MYPEICKIGPFTVYSYGLMLVTAFGVSSFLAARQARKENINPEIIFNLLFFVFICGILGARIFYVVQNLKDYLKDPKEIIMLQHGGMAWFGGLFAGVIASVVYLKIKKLHIFKIIDLVIPFLALAQSIGRIGCLLNGCCFGKPSPEYGIYFPVHGASLIPTQIYSSLLLLAIFIVLRFLQDKPHKEGQIFFVYLLLYAPKRFFIEYLRADNPIVFSGLTLFQILSAVVFCLSLAGLVYLARKKK